MFYAKYTLNGEEHATLYHSFGRYIVDTFSPEINDTHIIAFRIKGTGYKARKQELRNIAIDWSNNGNAGNLSWLDTVEISDWFYRNGKRYGMLAEFRENGLC